MAPPSGGEREDDKRSGPEFSTSRSVLLGTLNSGITAITVASHAGRHARVRLRQKQVIVAARRLKGRGRRGGHRGYVFGPRTCT